MTLFLLYFLLLFLHNRVHSWILQAFRECLRTGYTQGRKEENQKRSPAIYKGHFCPPKRRHSEPAFTWPCDIAHSGIVTMETCHGARNKAWENGNTTFQKSCRLGSRSSDCVPKTSCSGWLDETLSHCHQVDMGADRIYRDCAESDFMRSLDKSGRFILDVIIYLSIILETRKLATIWALLWISWSCQLLWGREQGSWL